VRRCWAALTALALAAQSCPAFAEGTPHAETPRSAAGDVRLGHPLRIENLSSASPGHAATGAVAVQRQPLPPLASTAAPSAPADSALESIKPKETAVVNPGSAAGNEAALPGAGELGLKILRDAEALGFAKGAAGEPSVSSVRGSSSGLSAAPAGRTRVSRLTRPVRGLSRGAVDFIRGFKFPKPLWILAGNLFLMQLGVEAMGLAGPILAKDLMQSWIGTTILAITASVALSLGSMIATPLNKRLGAGKSYMISIFFRGVGIAAMAYLLAKKRLSAANLMVVYLFDYIFDASNSVTEKVLVARQLAGNSAMIGRYNALRSYIIGAIGFAGPYIASLLITAWGGEQQGYSKTLFICSVLCGVCLIGSILSGLSRTSTPAVTSAPQKQPHCESMSVKDVLAHIWRSPILRGASLIYGLFKAVLFVIYFMIAAAYGSFAAGADQKLSTGIIAVLTGLFAGMGLLGSYLFDRASMKAGQQAERSFPSDDAARKAFERATLYRRIAAWTVLASLSLLALWSAFWTSPLVTVPVPLRPTQLLIIPLGIMTEMVATGLMTIIQEEAPSEGKVKTIGLTGWAASSSPPRFRCCSGWR
jgi:MFS family permease